MAPLFDMILLDEASQMDVANAILAIAAIADDGALTIAGDPQQLPRFIRRSACWFRMYGRLCL